MKEFVKTMLAVICGIIVLQLIGFIFFLILVGSMASSGKTPMPRNGVLDINLADFTLSEQTQESAPDVRSLNFEVLPNVGMHDAVKALEAAAADPAIKFVFMRPEGIASISAAEEMRAALLNFRRSGKAVVAYIENPNNVSYYLASACDKIYMGPYHGSSPQMTGLSGQMLFVKDLLSKLGVNVQLIRHGKYKSAGEMFINSHASDANREQNQAMINSMWETVSTSIAVSRGIEPAVFNGLVDNLSLIFPEDFLNAGLVDELLDREALVDKLCMLGQLEDASLLHLVAFSDYVGAKVNSFPSHSNVGVIYADGEIVEGDELADIAGDRFVREIEKARKDATVKAVVLRVNSPGGSVLASEKIRGALDRLMAEKPLVASYGAYAASGGYWISNGCQRIFSDATTLTGSIGVFSMIPEFSGTAAKLGVNMEMVNSNAHSDVYSLMRPFDAAELAFMQASVEDIYGRFVSLVAEGRFMEPSRVDEIAQGRVWTGAEALEIGLVDEIGTLEDAIAYAASLAGMVQADEYGVVPFPRPLTMMEQMLQSFGQSSQEPSVLTGTPFESAGRCLRNLSYEADAKVYALMPWYIDIR